MALNRKYLILLVDRKRARMFTLVRDVPLNHLELEHDQAPPKVKKGENNWDAADKISRHIEDHLHKHLSHVGEGVEKFARQEKITDILIGSHRTLFRKIEAHLKYPFSKKVRGKFVTELKVPQKEVLQIALKAIEKLEARKEKDRLRKALKT